MKYSLALFFLLFLTISAEAQRPRRLLLFASDAANADLKAQRQMLQVAQSSTYQSSVNNQFPGKECLHQRVIRKLIQAARDAIAGVCN